MEKRLRANLESKKSSTTSGRIIVGRATNQRRIPFPNLTEQQKTSYEQFLKEGLVKILSEISPITDYTGHNFQLDLYDLKIGRPKFEAKEAVEKGVSFEVPLSAMAKLTDLEARETQAQEVFLGEIPLMTERGTFIINGVERTVVAQLARSPGVYFERELDPVSKRFLYTAEIKPERGVWIRFETSRDDTLWVRAQRAGRKIGAASFLKAFGLSKEEIEQAVSLVDTDSNHHFLANTFAKDPTANQEEAYLEIYSKLRPGDPRILENARIYFSLLLLEKRHYSLGKVGRYKINRRLGQEIKEDEELYRLQKEDLLNVVKELVRLNVDQGEPDDIDHLGNRRIRGVGELVGQSVRIGLIRLERLVKERLSLAATERKVTPLSLVNARPVVASLNEFFGSSQLAQFLDMENPLSVISHLRRVSALGPGGLSRERAGTAVRDVQPSHYGRLDVIETPEGQNIGLNLNLALYSRLNEYGFLEAPYFRVNHKTHGHFVDDQELIYLDAFDEEKYRIAESTVPTGQDGRIAEGRVPVRFQGDFLLSDIAEVDLIDASSFQMLGVSSGLIPFVSSDVGNRALMGANMQRQAVPLISSVAPLVGTGLEENVARDSGFTLWAKREGVVSFVDATRIEILNSSGKDRYSLTKFTRSNKDTCFNQVPRVKVGQRVRAGEILTDGPSSKGGEIALGRDLLAAFIPWDGYNYEDSIIVSERVIKEDLLTSIHIKEYEAAVMDTKLGPEEVTRDIPNVAEDVLRNLDENGIVAIGSEVRSGDILVGKIAPKGETELTAEERLLRAIFGEKAREVRDTSLYLPHGERGTVLSIHILEKAKGDELGPGVLRLIRVKVSQMRKIEVGDKVAGRHGSKGVVAKVVHEEDMPYLENGQTVDILLNPISILARMNIGQILETHLGWAGFLLGETYAISPYDRIESGFIQEKLQKAGLPISGKVTLFDGRSGEPFPYTVTVGFAHIMKLNHLVEDKVHARSTGPYSLITQQPLGGKAQMGGQRLGEMEVWALEAYGAAHTLQEMLTIKSDDVVGRSKSFEAIIKGLAIPEARTPETFKLLVKELNSLGLSIEMLKSQSDGSQEAFSKVSKQKEVDGKEG